MSRPRSDRVLKTLGVYHLAKALLLTALGLGALKLLQPSVIARAEEWGAALAVRNERHVMQRLIAVVIGLPQHRLQEVAIGAFVFAALFATEGVGLWAGLRWAQYLTVIATMLFIPLEIVQVSQRVTWTRVAVLALNLAVVALLIWHLRAHRAAPGSGDGAAA